MTEPCGVLVVDKPASATSHQVVARARRALGTRKIGHAGTLDPMATGVLVLGVGRGTRLLAHLIGADKAYAATIRLGQATTTDDAEGEITDAPGAVLDRARVEQGLGRYRGTFAQVPSAVSAIKVGGQRAYARVRRGEDVQLAGREVTVSRLEVLDARATTSGGLPVLDVDVAVECSSGTYIRALARDLGRDLGAGGHLTALRRTRVGPFGLDSVGWDGVLGELEPGERLALPLLSLADAARRCFPVVDVDADVARDVGYGRPLRLSVPANPTGLVHDGRLLALYAPADGGSVPVSVLVP